MVVTIDDTELCNTVMDVTRITAKFVDQLGNPLPYYNGIISVETSDNLDVIGPKLVAAVGGRMGFWIKSKSLNETGVGYATLRVPNTDIPAKTLEIALRPDVNIRLL